MVSLRAADLPGKTAEAVKPFTTQTHRCDVACAKAHLAECCAFAFPVKRGAVIERQAMDQPKPDISPQTLAKWQRVVDLISELADVPAALIMSTVAQRHSVYVANASETNPYSVGQSFQLNEKLYCYGVFQNDDELLVEDAASEPRWQDNQDLEYGMSFYVGLPLKWPDGEVFGTVCVLDKRRNRRALMFRKGLREFCRVMEDDLALLVEVAQRKEAELQLSQALEDRESIIQQRTQDLQDANTTLRVVLQGMETSRSEIEARIRNQIKELVLPHLSKLRLMLPAHQATGAHLEMIEQNLTQVTSAQSTRMAEAFEALTPVEAEIAQMIMHGRSTKEIAATLSRATSTVDFHRNNIRRKLGLTNAGRALKSHLNRVAK